jgi:hypothetical protein
MRTTLEIDDDILHAAKELARAEKKTAGQVLSELARKALTGAVGEATSGEEDPFIVKDGLVVLRSRGGIVTKEQVDRLIEEADLEDGRFSIHRGKIRK